MYRLLIIEDEEDLRNGIKELFEQDGNETYAAANGMVGIKMAAELMPDIILCDIIMPGLDGFVFKKMLNENSLTQDIPFIYLTAKAETDSFREGMDLGADDYIVKPIRNQELLNIVYKRLHRIEEISGKFRRSGSINKLTLADKILLNIGKEHLLVPLNDILFIEVLGNYTKLYLVDGKTIIQKKTLKKWEEMLPEKTFIRVHNNTIINFNYIERIAPLFNGALIVRVKQYPSEIICSRRYSQKIRKIFNNN